VEAASIPKFFSAHSARVDSCRRLGRTAEARASYEKALALTQQEPERQFLQESGFGSSNKKTRQKPMQILR
jgi:RNA polymerase sigma-70 factor (ECF subfamily)